MKRKYFSFVIMLVIMGAVFAGSGVTSYAQYDPKTAGSSNGAGDVARDTSGSTKGAGSEAKNTAGGAQVIKEEAPGSKPFSVVGNGEVLDDITDDETKQFITVRTKNNQTFFVVIDRANAIDNVYMLSMIDEDDLEEFLKDADDEDVLPAVEIPGKTDGNVTLDEDGNPIETDGVDTAVKDKKKSSKGMLFAAIGFVGLFGAGYYFFRFGKNKDDGGQASGAADNVRDADAEIEYADEYEEDDTGEYDEEYEDGEYDDEDYEEDPQDDGEYEEADEVEEETENADEEEELKFEFEDDVHSRTVRKKRPVMEDNTEDYYEEGDKPERELRKVSRRRRRRRK